MDLAAFVGEGDGVHWTLPAPADLNANLVVLEPGHHIDDHRNDAVDVLVVGVAGAGCITVEDKELEVAAHVVVHIPLGLRRSIVAGSRGLRYLTVHLRRGPLGLRPRG